MKMEVRDFWVVTLNQRFSSEEEVAGDEEHVEDLWLERFGEEFLWQGMRGTKEVLGVYVQKVGIGRYEERWVCWNVRVYKVAIDHPTLEAKRNKGLG